MSTNQPDAPKWAVDRPNLITLNAAMLRLFKGRYRDSGDRHSDALFVRDGLEVLQIFARDADAEIARLGAARDEALKASGITVSDGMEPSPPDDALLLAVRALRAEVERLTAIHVTCWNALRQADQTLRWLDVERLHRECNENVTAVKEALKLVPSESGSYVVILDTELESLRAQLATATKRCEELAKDKERAIGISRYFETKLNAYRARYGTGIIEPDLDAARARELAPGDKEGA